MRLYPYKLVSLPIGLSNPLELPLKKLFWVERRFLDGLPFACHAIVHSYSDIELCIFENKFAGITSRQKTIERTIKAINQLPEDKAAEISDFADFIMKRYEDDCLTEGIKHLTSNSQVFEFLKNEEDLYSETDLKELYNG